MNNNMSKNYTASCAAVRSTKAETLLMIALSSFAPIALSVMTIVCSL